MPAAAVAVVSTNRQALVYSQKLNLHNPIRKFILDAAAAVEAVHSVGKIKL